MAFKLVLLKGANIRKTITVRLLAWTVQKILFPHALLLYHTNRRHDTLPFNPVVLPLSNVGLILGCTSTCYSPLLAPMPVLLALAPLANVGFIEMVVSIVADSVLFVAARLALVRLVGSVRLDHEVTAARHGLRFVPRAYPLFFNQVFLSSFNSEQATA